MNQNVAHIPVLVHEVLSYMILPSKSEKSSEEVIYVDATLGGGSHTRALLQADLTCKVIGIDWDKEVVNTTATLLEQEFPGRFFFVWGNFSRIDLLVKKVGFDKVDAILADFGTSQMQIKNSEGFSVYRDTFLDMRMSSGHFKKTAYDVVNFFSEKELVHIFFEYGQESNARKIAQAIIKAREKQRIKTTMQLANLIKEVVFIKNNKIHPATKVFQALRIFVNKELENIQSFLKNSITVLKPNARLVCISFHSLEDRLVKQFFKDHNKLSFPENYFELLTKNACMASDEELNKNKSSRSARLRAGILRKSFDKKGFES